MSEDASPPRVSGFAIGTASARFAIEVHPHVDLSALFARDGAPPGCVAAIVPFRDGELAMRNVGEVTWAVTRGGGPARSVGPGEQVLVAAGTTLRLGAAILGIGEY